MKSKAKIDRLLSLSGQKQNELVQNKFLTGMIKRYKVYFLAGYTMKFITVLQQNIASSKLPLIYML